MAVVLRKSLECRMTRFAHLQGNTSLINSNGVLTVSNTKTSIQGLDNFRRGRVLHSNSKGTRSSTLDEPWKFVIIQILSICIYPSQRSYDEEHPSQREREDFVADDSIALCIRYISYLL